jgi:hypothetical protein
MLLTFQASAFDHSATSPLETQNPSKRVRKGTGGSPDDQIRGPEMPRDLLRAPLEPTQEPQTGS